MEKEVKKTGLARIPAWVLSLMTLFVLIILLVILEDPKNDGYYSTNQIIGYAFCAILITAACFFICRAHPSSFWYTIVICNSVTILGLIANIGLTIVVPDYSAAFSETILWVSIGVLSIIGAIFGARIGRRKINQQNN